MTEFEQTLIAILDSISERLSDIAEELIVIGEKI